MKKLPGAAAQKKPDPHSMKLLLTFARKYPLESAFTVVALLFAGIAEGFGISVLFPLLSTTAVHSSTGAAGAGQVGSTLEHLVREFFAFVGTTPTTGMLLIIFVACITLKSALVLLADRQVGYTVAHIATDLRLSLLRALFVSRWEYFLRQPIGRLTNAIATESTRSANAFTSASRLASTGIEAMICAVLALLVSWKTSLVALFIGFFIVYLLKRFIKKAKRAGKRQTDLLQSLIAQMTDSLQSIKPLKAMARENAADTVLTSKTEKLNRALRKQAISKAALGAFQEPLLVTFLALLLYAALEHMSMSLVTVVAMVYLIRRILKNVQKIQQDYQEMTTYDSAYWSIQEKIADAGKEIEPALGNRLPALNTSIRLNHVGFAYDQKMILKDISIELPAGESVTLTGPSGAGKTTVADLIIGLLRPQKGEVWIDDLPLAEVDIRSWRRMIGYVPQETLLLHDTVLINVTLGDKEIGEDRVKAALRSAGAWDFVSNLPHGIHTIVGERGSKVSGGQRQRIAIARALVHEPKLLILDEATSALDPESETAICETLRKLKRKLTILAISHQPALVKIADRAYRLEAGKAYLMPRSGRGEVPAPEIGSEKAGDGLLLTSSIGSR
jgi:ATP-binding cassette subfamily C protein